MLEVCIHTDHSFSFCFAEPAHDCRRKAPFTGANNDTDVITFILKSLNCFNGSISGVVIYDNDFGVGEGGGGGVRGEGGKEACD